MSTARIIKKKARRLADDAEMRLEDAHDEMDAALEEGAEAVEGARVRWTPILAVAGLAAIGLFLLMRRRRESRLQRGAHQAVDKAFRLSNDARDSARALAERSQRWIAKMPRVRVEMP